MHRLSKVFYLYIQPAPYLQGSYSKYSQAGTVRDEEKDRDRAVIARLRNAAECRLRGMRYGEQNGAG